MRECEDCEIGKVAPKKGSVSCSPCGAGKFGEEGPVCTDCDAGRYRDGNTNSSLWCEACPAGFYQDKIGQASCLPCMPGEFQDKNNSANCIKCKKGRFREGDAASALSCEACLAGFYQDNEGQASCLPCVPGKYAAHSGMTACTKCSVNTFSNTINMTMCHDCEIGKVALENGSVSCSPCGAGKFGEEGPVCTKCHVGRYRDGNTNSSIWCEACPAGFSQKNEGQALCLRCVPGKFQDKKNSANCTKCKEGRYRQDNGDPSKCESCPPRYMSKEGSTSCDKCQIGRFGNRKGAGDCEDCPDGKYVDTRGEKKCKTCSMGKIPNDNKTQCVPPEWKTESDCDPNEYLNNSDSDRYEWECEPCMRGADCKATRTLDKLLPEDGWWTVPKEYDPEPENYYLECPYPEDCRWNASTNSSCKKGTINTSVGCSVCEVGWDRIGRDCTKCLKTEVATRAGGFLGAVFVVSLLVWATRKYLRLLQKKRPGLWRDVMLLIKILVSFTQ
eukprot:g764.t1